MQPIRLSIKSFVFIMARRDDNILFIFYLKSGVCCFCPIENQQNRLNFASDRHSKIENEVYVIDF